MSAINNTTDELLHKIKKIVEENLHDEHFGVSELAAALGMSRSYLHRKVNAVTKTSVSQLIRQIRLKKAKKFLRETSFTVSEVAYKVGFNSVTYFNKCFRDYYGYPPGQVNSRNETEEKPTIPFSKKLIHKKNFIPTVVILFLFVVLIYVLAGIKGKNQNLEKSIAVLIWKDNSLNQNDKHIINTINNYVHSGLQKVGCLTVSSRRAVLIYEKELKTPKEIHKELKVDLILDARGFISKNRLELTVELIDAKSGNEVWGETFYENLDEIIGFKPELTKKIINEGLNITLTKEEKRKIEKVVTQDIEANKFYSMGLQQLNLAQCNYMCNHQPQELVKHLEKAKDHFKNAIDIDSTLSPAYANLARIYYFMGIADQDTNYRDQIISNAADAYKHDINSEDALIAQAYSCLIDDKHELAIDFLEEAVQVNPNSSEAIGRLVNIYGFRLRQANHFVRYAMQNVQINNGITEDQLTSATINYCASTALSRLAFFKEAEPFFHNVLEIMPNHSAAFSGLAFNRLYSDPERIEKTLNFYVNNFPKGGYSGGFDSQVGYMYYLMEDYNNAYDNFKIQLEQQGKFGHVSHLLSFYQTLQKLGNEEEIKKYEGHFQTRMDNYKSPRHMDFYLSVWYSLRGENEKALEHLENVSHSVVSSYKLIYELYHASFFEDIKTDNKFLELREKIEEDFWEQHEEIRVYLDEENLSKPSFASLF